MLRRCLTLDKKTRWNRRYLKEQCNVDSYYSYKITKTVRLCRSIHDLAGNPDFKDASIKTFQDAACTHAKPH